MADKPTQYVKPTICCICGASLDRDTAWTFPACATTWDMCDAGCGQRNGCLTCENNSPIRSAELKKLKDKGIKVDE